MVRVSSCATFPASLGELPHLIHWLQTQAAPLHIESKTLRQIELAVEEAVVNIIRHGYKETPGMIQITLEGVTGKEISLAIKDQAPPFDPLIQVPSLRCPNAIETAQEGGLGLYFLRQAVDAVHYRHEGKDNVLVLIKILA